MCGPGRSTGPPGREQGPAAGPAPKWGGRGVLHEMWDTSQTWRTCPVLERPLCAEAPGLSPQLPWRWLATLAGRRGRAGGRAQPSSVSCLPLWLCLAAVQPHRLLPPDSPHGPGQVRAGAGPAGQYREDASPGAVPQPCRSFLSSPQADQVPSGDFSGKYPPIPGAAVSLTLPLQPVPGAPWAPPDVGRHQSRPPTACPPSQPHPSDARAGGPRTQAPGQL